ncbi:MAG: DUF115 domain-containing protein [Acidobacteriia bacterium]|nr:DUF115 domain-containing protein [Terriglobia bacterium]
MDCLELNLAALAPRQPELARLLSGTDLTRLQLSPSRKGPPTAFYRRDAGDPVPLHSRYDPMPEARQSLKDLDLAEADYFVFLGFGLGYGLDALLERVAPETAHIFVVESDLEILLAALAARDLTSWLALPNIHFAWPAGGNELAQQWKQFFDPVQARKSVFISHPPSLVLKPGLFKAAAEIIKSQTLQIFTDINTLVGKAPVFLDNFITNFSRASSSPGVSAFARRFAGVPAVLVAAGPSLDRNIHELRPFQNQVLVLAADTALKPLLASGIEPHFVLSGDPGYENYLHLKDAVARETYLVAEATAYPETLASFNGRTILCRFENSSLRTLSELLASKGTLRAWGSVATMCLDFALLLGCDPVIFVGQDLAFSDGRTYCSGLHWEEQWFHEVGSPDAWQRRWAELRASNRIVVTEDLFGRPVETTDKLMAYWNWIGSEIEKHPEVNFINATEGGMLRDNLAVMSLHEALHRCGDKQHDLRDRIRRVFSKAASSGSIRGTVILAALEKESGQLEAVLAEGIQLCTAGNPALGQEDLARLERVNESLHTLSRLAPIIDSFNQLGNTQFLRRRAALGVRLHGPAGISELRGAYLEYFQSVARARTTIDDALRKLNEAVKGCTGRGAF